MLEVNNLTKLFGYNQGCQHISFKVSSKEIVGVLGRNGSGKTTLFRCLLNLLEPDEGTFIVHSKQPKEIQLGYLPEERSMITDLRVYEMVELFARLKKMSLELFNTRLDYWLEVLKCQELKYNKIRNCSKGNQQKIQFIIALIHKPDVLILDEPLTGLDLDNVKLFKQVILRCKQEGMAILLSSHQYEEIDNLCDRLLVLEKSEVKIYDELINLKKNCKQRTVTISNDPTIEYALFQGVIDIRVDGQYTKYKFGQESDAVKLVTAATKERKGRTIKIDSLTIADLVGDTF